MALSQRWCAVLIATLALATTSCQQRPQDSLVHSTSGWQAVMLTSGQVYFGKLEGLGTPYPVLREVYYVQTTENPQTHERGYNLIKRGQEGHAPDRMIINAQHILLIEPVGRESRVAQLIAEAQAKSQSK